MHLRLVVDPYAQRVYFDYSQDGIDWIRGGYSNAAYSNACLQGTNIALFSRNTSTSGPNIDVTFKYIKCFSGSDISFGSSDWGSEEAQTRYPIAPTGATDNTQKLTFNTSGILRGTPLTLRTKEHGGGYKNTKNMAYEDKLLINIGPDGMDKYIGMKLSMDFNFGPSDTFNINEIDFIYEVV